MTHAILTDIEGTTSSLTFVKDVLFPYSCERMEHFIARKAGEPAVARELEEVNRLAGRTMTPAEAARELVEWICQDRKLTPLKALQGMIWEAGYRKRDFFGHVYPDAVRKLREWHEKGLALFVFSSGSVHAQKLLFGHTEYGDLAPLFSDYFDTRIGAKQDAGSYRAIAAVVGFPPESILFLSDTVDELDAAWEAGLATTWLTREGFPADPGRHPMARNFDEISV